MGGVSGWGGGVSSSLDLLFLKKKNRGEGLHTVAQSDVQRAGHVKVSVSKRSDSNK